MPDDMAAVLETDLPYSVAYTGKDRPRSPGSRQHRDWSDLYKDVPIEHLGAFLDAVFTAVLPHVRRNAGIYIWHGHHQYSLIEAAFEKHGLRLHQPLVWRKAVATCGHSFYQWRHEHCVFGWKLGYMPDRAPGQWETIWEADFAGRARATGIDHPCEKPTRLFEIPMEVHTKPGAIVLDPFCGSGSSIIAAEKLGRRCRALEIQPAFVDAAIRRWQKATRKQATLDGKTFAEVAAERSKNPEPS
jgi:DNA modification methylase